MAALNKSPGEIPGHHPTKGSNKMEYLTQIPAYNAETHTEYTKLHTTPDNLNNMVLFAIGGSLKDDFCTNWDIYATEDGTLYSIARNGSGCRNTYFGDVNHIRHLMREGYWSSTLTPYGFKLMNYRDRRRV